MRRAWPAIAVTALCAVSLVLTAVWGSPTAAGNGQLAGYIAFLVMLAITTGVGGVLAARLPRNAIGWLLLLISGLFLLELPLTALGDALQAVAPEVSVWLFWWGAPREDSWAWVFPVALLFTQLPLRFPTGSLPSPRWRWFSIFTIVWMIAAGGVLSTISVEVRSGVANPAHIEGIAETPVAIAAFAGLAVSFLGSIASLVARYRRATVIERAQLRWMMWAVAVVAALLVTSWFVPTDTIVSETVLAVVVLGGYALIPLSIGIAVLRYRLYDIDRIISRTAAYAVVTVVIVASYAAIVLSVGWLLPTIPAIGVALATLTVAAIFLPVLRVVQRFVDRRFDRAQYDAQQVVDAFGARIRNGEDPHGSAADLLDATAQTLQPSVLGLWTPRR